MFKKILSRLLLLRPGEEKVVYFLFALAGLIGFGMSIGQVSSDALFFKLYGVDYLPHMFALIAVALFVSSLFYAAFVDRFTHHHMLLNMMIGFAVMIALSWIFMLGADEKTGFALYFIAYGVISELLLTHFYFYLTSFFDTQQAKRLLPPILAVSLLGRSLGGVFVGAVGSEIPIQHVALVWVVCIFITIVLIAKKHHGEPKHNIMKTGQSSKPIKMLHEGIMYARESPLIRISAISMFLLVLLFCVQEYLVGKIFVQHYTNEQDLARFFGWFSSILSLAVLLVQLFLSSRLLRIFGLSNMNLIYPVSTFLSFGIMAISANFFAAVLGRINIHGVMPCFRNPIAGLFNQALPVFMQGRVGALMTGLILPLGLLGAALFLSIVPQGVALESIAASAAVMAIILIWVKHKKNKAYSNSLVELIGNSVFAEDTNIMHDLNGIDRATAFKLAEKIKTTDILPVINNYADMLELLAKEHAGTAMLNIYPELEDHAQNILLPRIAKLTPKGWEKVAWNVAMKGDSHLMETTVFLLLNAKYPPAFKKSAGWLESAKPRLQSAVAVACLHIGVHTDKSLDVLETLLTSDNPDDCLSALGALALKPYPCHADFILKMLNNENERARALALDIWSQTSAAKTDQAINIIDKAILDPSYTVRSTAITAASRLSYMEMPFLKWLTHALRDIDFRVRDAGLACAKMFMPKTPEDWDTALEKHKNNFELEQVMISHLASSGIEHKEDLLRHALSEHLSRAREKLLILQESKNILPGENPAIQLFQIALREDARRHFTSVLHILGCLDHSPHMSCIRAGLLSDNRYLWAQSMESALQLKKESYIFRELAKLFEAEREGVKLKGNLPGKNNSLQTWLEWCRIHGSEWLSECSSYCLSHDGLIP